VSPIKPNLIKSDQIKALPEKRHVHQFNDSALRMTRTLGTAAGLERIGIHLVRLPPGYDSTQFHSHSADEEFIYILEGRATAEIGDLECEVGPGDFIGLPVPSPAHNLHNSFTEDCCYLVGGERNPLDVVDYPRIRRSMLKHPRRWVDWDHVNEID
jgi:uncharacterized cupin superfamily protein